MKKITHKVGFEEYLKNTKRIVTEKEKNGQKTKVVTLERIYETTIEDLWDALTNTQRLARWLVPVSGELTAGGHYKLEGNAEGDILTCEKPNYLSLNWGFGGEISWVEVTLIKHAKNTVKLRLDHTVYLSPHWDTFGPGAVGVGWELALWGLMNYINFPDRQKIHETELVLSAEGKEFIGKSSKSWGKAAIEAGEKEEEAMKAAANTTAFYTGSKGEI